MLKIEQRQGEQRLSVANDEGVTVDDLRELLAGLPGNMQAGVALCIEGVDTYTARIVKINNEGDNSVLWVHVDRQFHDAIQASADHYPISFELVRDGEVVSRHSVRTEAEERAVIKAASSHGKVEQVNRTPRSNDVVDATYTSQWSDTGDITTPCKFNLRSRHCFDIQDSNDAPEGNLEREYVTLPNGEQLDVTDGVTFDY